MAEPQEHVSRSVLQQKRKALRQRVTTILNEAEPLLEATDVSVDYVNRCSLLLDRIQKFSSDLSDVDAKLETLFSVEQVETEFDRVLEYQDRITTVTCLLKRKLACQPSAQQGHAVIDNTQQGCIESSRRPHLPKLELIKFDGSREHWQEFWIRFESLIHSNSSLSNNEKMSYLATVLTGEAAASIKGLQLTGGMYDTTINMLKERFGNPNALIQFHLKRLLAVSAVRSSRQVSDLRRLHDTLRAHMRSLEALGTKPSSYSSLLYPVIQQALPNDLVLSFQRKLHGDVPDAPNDAQDHHEKVLGKLLDFLKMEVECREQLTATDSVQDFHEQLPQRKSRERLPSAAALGTEARKSNSPQGKKVEPCFFCGKDHDVRKCRVEADLEDLEERLRKSHRCFRCAKENHTARVCRSVKSLKCEQCGGRHLTVLCRQDRASANGTVVASGTWKRRFEYQQVVLLQTGYAMLCTIDGRERLIRFLIDGGSQRTFIKKSLSRKLKLPVVGKERLAINTVGKAGTFALHYRVAVNLRSQYTAQEFTIEALEIPEICVNQLPNIDRKSLNRLKDAGMQLADTPVLPGSSREICLLLGADFYAAVVTGKQVRLDGNLLALETAFGWTMQGPMEAQPASQFSSFHVCVSDIGRYDVDQTLKSFWDLEHLGISDALVSNEEDSTLQSFEDTIMFENGRYSVRLPWKDHLVPKLGTNKQTAELRLRGAMRTLLKDQDVLNEYDQVIRQYLQNGHAERVDDTASSLGPVYYMPHHAVIRRERETTKVRIVFDASSSASGSLSLNDVLHAGPNLNEDILSLLLRFRMHRIALVADVEKAFLQISLQAQDTDALRFIWYSETPIAGQLLPNTETWRMTRVPFGARSSPFLLTATIRHHLRSSEPEYPETAAVLLTSFYVDDLVVSLDNTQEATKLYEDTLRIFAAAGMKVKKWVTNDEALLLRMFRDGNATVQMVKGQTKKVLGMVWNLQQDELRCPLASVAEFVCNKDSGKRSILQAVSRVYDPFGQLAPFTITGKILLQKLWEAELDWEDPLPTEIDLIWSSWRIGLTDLIDLSIPRFIGSYQGEGAHTVHIFADASPVAYGAVVYIQRRCQDGESMELLLSKSRVAPLKRQTLPRLELMAALLAARLYRFLCATLKTVHCTCWTDSQITLHWIKGSVTRWKTFVANRVQEIRAITSPEMWRHCPGDENPADLLTRGITGQQLRTCQLWWKGPPWLTNPDTWPQVAPLDSFMPEEDECIVTATATSISQVLPPPERYSTANKLIRVTAWILRYVTNLKNRDRRQAGPLTTDEVVSAERYWIAVTQARFLEPNSPCLESFRTYKDPEGILRLHGRLQHSDLPTQLKYPILLPPASHSWFTRLLILREHERLFHSGVQETLQQLREEFWIIRGRQSVKYALHYCFFCRRLKARSCSEQEAPLPADRVMQQLPFETVGVDFAGPLYYQTERGHEKSYVLLFTCAVTRAIHLELVTDQAFGSFLMALKRFVARRGIPRKVYSDNFLTFKKASRELPAMLSGQFQAVQEYATQLRITWEFIVERAPWWGGFWERMVRSVKEVLRRTLRRSELGFLELQTVITEVEAIINSRPLTQLTEDPDDVKALSPSHLLIGKRLTALPPMAGRRDVLAGSSPTEMREAQERLLNSYWKHWKKHYLLQLRSANQTRQITSTNVQQHQLVMLADHLQARTLWKLARVQQVHFGRDGLVRSCTLRTSNSTVIRRPIQLLHPLELQQ